MTYTGSLANCQTLNALQNKLEGYPVVGVHIGGGVHVPMPPTWDGVGPVPPGWTAYSDQSLSPVPASANWQTPADGKDQDAASVATLSPADQLALSAVLSAGTIVVTPITDVVVE